MGAFSIAPGALMNDRDSLPLNRRQLIKGAVGAAAMASTLPHVNFVFGESSENSAANRVRESFDFGWMFRKGDYPGADQPQFPDSDWTQLDLPHDWSIEGPFGEHEPSGPCGGYLPTGVGWYRKRFRVPDSYRNKKISIIFDGVYENSEVWINGQSLGKRPYGYVPFFYDLTPHLNFDRENLMAVRADNSRQTNCRWYSGSGIYRHTWLLATNPVHIAQWGTFVSTPDASKTSASVRLSAKIKNETEKSARCTLVSELLDEEGRVLQSAEASQELAGGQQSEFQQQMKVDHPRLWSVADPYLYRIRSTVKVQNHAVDEYETPLGIRTAAFDADKGFLLNGERLKMKGVCLHHDGGCVGAAVPERVWERRLETLREMGCNAIRTSHNPPAAEFLDLCDRMGFLVMNEAFDEWRVPKGQIGPHGYANYFDEWHERDVQNFVRRDRNHPSVVLWSAGNEIGDQDVPEGAAILKKLLEIFHAEDPTRPVTAGCDHIAAEPPEYSARPEFLAQLDVVGYNYSDRWRDRREKYYSIDRHAYPHRRVLGTESESINGIRDEYPELFPDTSPLSSFFQLLRGRNIDVEQLCRFVGTYDYVAGDFMWTGIDHIGEARWPMKGSFTGVLDCCGFKKDGFYFYQSLWTDSPVLHLFPHWNWKGREGQVIPVTCYTNCDTVELFVNGKSFGAKGYAFPRLGMELCYGNYPKRAQVLRTTADLHLSWDVPYQPGKLKAVGVKNEQVVSTTEVVTTGESAAIIISADRDRISADPGNVVHFTCEIVDADARRVPTADNEVSIELQGDGKLIGMDNGDPRSHEDYRSNRCRAFHGLCLAIIKPIKSGSIHIAATSPSLKSATAQVVVKA